MTAAEKERYFEEHATQISKVVLSFMHRGTTCPVRISYNDLYQSVCVALLEYLSQCETEEQAQLFPYYSALHAMTVEIMRLQPLTGLESTRKLHELLQAQPIIVDLEHANGLTKTWLADTITKNDFYSFYDNLDSSMRDLVCWRLSGATVSNVSQLANVNRQTVYNRMKKLREQYREQMS